MRLSAELLESAEQRTNPLGEREIVLRGLAIPGIEHLGVTRDALDAMDFTDNRLGSLDNFPKLLRLSSLKLSGNVIETVDPANLSKNIPNLRFMDLSNNRISSLFQVAALGKACPKLQYLSLKGNSVTRRQHYRLYAIKHIPTLKSLDYTKITKTERERAERLANSAAGAALESDVQAEANSSTSNSTKTFVPGEGTSAKETFVTSFTKEQKDLIREMVANANSPAEIEEIERSVKRGIFPVVAGNGNKRALEATADGTPTKKSRL